MSAICLLFTLGSALQTTFTAHFATRIVAGIVGGAAESLLPLILSEITFLHQRPRIYALYWAVQNALSSTLNVSASYEASLSTWRWYYWTYVIALSVGLIFNFFTLYETRFVRPAASVDGQIIVTDEFSVTRAIPDSEAQEYLE